jgi:acetyl-CoA/propionyl-CoA carboxylase carboxyl transferase subunit
LNCHRGESHFRGLQLLRSPATLERMKSAFKLECDIQSHGADTPDHLEASMTTATVASIPGNTREPDPRDPVTRLSSVMDAGSLSLIVPASDTGVIVARGLVNGTRVLAYCTDARRMGGALGAVGAGHIVRAVDLAVHERSPIIGLWHSGGARLAEGVDSMDGVGQMFAAMTRASGQVPQLSIAIGPAAGAAAYGPALTDVVVMSADGRLFVTGPDIVRNVTGEQVDMESLGGAGVHGNNSGVAHVVTNTEADAYARARDVITLLSRPGVFHVQAVHGTYDYRSLLPDSARRAYDVRPLVRQLLDAPDTSADPNAVTRADGFIEFQERWARNVVVGLGRLGGRTVGVIANNPLHKGGCLDSLSAEKAARFVRMCDSFGISLLVIVDVPGYLPGVRQEWGGVVRRGAKLLHAFAESVVPRVTLITRKAYGGAYIAMNSRALGASRVLAWPDAEIAVMGPAAAIEILHRKKLANAPDSEREELRSQLIAEHARFHGGVHRSVDIGVVDEIIDPADSRRRIGEALAAAPGGRGHHGNIPL